MAEAVSIGPAPPRAVLAVTAFRETAPLCDALSQLLGVGAPDGPYFACHAGTYLFRLAPSRFLVMAPAFEPVLERLVAALDGLAAVTDQSDAWAIFAVCGAAAHEALARVVPVDVAPRRMAPGSVILTRSGALEVRLWKLDDSAFEITTGRSMGADLLHALHTAARSLPTG